jgi:hypothetical protein
MDPKSVIEAMEGITLKDAPRGPMTVEPVGHHVAVHMYLVKGGADGNYHLIKYFGLIPSGPQCKFG